MPRYGRSPWRGLYRDLTLVESIFRRDGFFSAAMEIWDLDLAVNRVDLEKSGAEEDVLDRSKF